MSVEEDVLDSVAKKISLEDAARLLSDICPGSINNNAAYGLDSAESFACLLYRNDTLFDMVKNAFTSRDFDGVWARCIQICSPQSLKTYTTISEVLTQLSPNLTNLVKGQIESPLWTLSDEYKFKDSDAQAITSRLTFSSLIKQKRVPSMLFYDLGSFKNDPILHERVQKLFCKKQNTFFVNASATGKTRLLYEGLFHHWGIYVTAHADNKEAQALETTLNTSFGGEDEMVEILPDASALGYQKLLDDNLKLLFRRFSIVLLAHLLVFREFLKTAHEERVIDNEGICQLWLLAQLWRPCLSGCDRDIHRQLVKVLEWEPLAIVNKELTGIIDEIKLLLPGAIRKEGLFVAIDEANVAATSIWFDKAESHPPIRSLIRTWRDQLVSLDCPVTFVVAGTQIDHKFFPSTSPEWSSWKWTSDTGSFNDREIQEAYISPFLPPSLLKTPAGTAFLERIWNWCRSRHRLTTAIIQMLIEDKVIHPHSVLNRYIQRLVSYEAADGAAFITNEGPCKVVPSFHCIGSLIEQSIFARSATHEVVFHYIVTGKHPPSYDISRLELVTSGVGQFNDNDMQVITMDQPGPTIAAAIWLGNDRERVRYQHPDELRSLRLFKPFSFFFNFPWPNGDNYSSAGYIAWYLAHTFVDGRVMSDVFAIPDPLWLEDVSRMAHLVVLRKDEDVVQELFVGPSELLSTSPPLGFRASTVDDVIAWFKQERVGAFCLCPPDCWADLIFVLYLRGKYVWVVLRAAGQGIQLDTKDLYLEFERLTEQNLFSRVINTSDITANQNDLSEVLKSLPNTLAPHGSFPILRVLATFPNEPLFPRRNPTRKIPGGPVSVLRLDTFKSVTEAFSPEDLVEGLISSMHGNRSSYSDDSFAPINLVSSSPTSKQEEDTKAAGQPTTGSSSHTKTTLRVDRPIRPIPRHKTPPPKLPAEPRLLASQIAKEVAPARESKRARRQATDKSLESSSAPLPHRTRREHHSKGTAGK
ncbi:hypothetical protein H2248_006849 [Termitomyces sp. 'cryptogamus']|nr:hypothetical protein H2248_006849 [Termitomyces sp. 'cryptogamus']